MAFWSSQTLESQLGRLIDPPDAKLIDCNSITLRVGREIFITPHMDEVHTQTKRLLDLDSPFQIPPEQFAIIMTEERVMVPPELMAFISMKATFKMQGLINVSGFHVDPGWDGHLIFAVYNAGPSPVHLQRGLPLFLIWYAELDHPSARRKSVAFPATVPPNLIGNLTHANDSLHALDTRLKEEVEKRRDETVKLTDRVHGVEKSQEQIKVTFAVLLTLLVGLLLFLFRGELSNVLRPEAQNAAGQSADRIELEAQSRQPNAAAQEEVPGPANARAAETAAPAPANGAPPL